MCLLTTKDASNSVPPSMTTPGPGSLKWWPQDDVSPGDRAEIGTTRDQAWHAALTKLARGIAIAIDYGHQLGDRVPVVSPAER